MVRVAESILGTPGMRWEYTLDGKPVHLRPPHTNIHRIIYTLVQHTFFFFGEVGGQKEDPEETHADTENMRNSMESNPSSGANHGPWSREVETLPLSQI